MHKKTPHDARPRLQVGDILPLSDTVTHGIKLVGWQFQHLFEDHEGVTAARSFLSLVTYLKSAFNHLPLFYDSSVPCPQSSTQRITAIQTVIACGIAPVPPLAHFYLVPCVADT